MTAPAPAPAPAGYAYRAFDGQNWITREGLDLVTLKRHWSNLVVSGYRIEVWQVTSLSEADVLVAIRNNKVAQEGCDRCGHCGCKYWENDLCVDCGAPVSEKQSEKQRENTK